MLSYDSMMQRNASMHRSASFVENLSKLCQVFPNVSASACPGCGIVPLQVIVSLSHMHCLACRFLRRSSRTVLRQHQGNLQNASEALLASEGGEGDDALVCVRCCHLPHMPPL